MTVKAQISEADVVSVKNGLDVYFTILGSDKKYFATLRQIEPAPESINTDGLVSPSSSNKSAVYYNALFDVPNKDAVLRIDMTAQVSIILSKASNTLAVPSSALLELDELSNSDLKITLNSREKQLIKNSEASLAVVKILQDNGSIQVKEVLVGINNSVNAQIIKGLKEGEKVIIADNSFWGRFICRFAFSSTSLMALWTGSDSPLPDVIAGLESKRYTFREDQLISIMSLIAGSVLTSIFLVLEGHKTWRDAGTEIAELLLCALGISREEAFQIARMELPPLLDINNSH